MIGISSHVFLLLLTLQTVAVVKANSEDNLVRRKRLWIPPPKQLMENEDYTQEKTVAKLHSDFDEGNGNIIYYLEGIGANQHPFNVFVIDQITGDIRVTKILDRELIDTYNLSGVAKYKDGRLAEKNVDIRFKVKDQNDNSPVFADMEAGAVTELSAPGTSVMKIMATDADEPGNTNSQIAYTILDQSPPDEMFGISQDGTVFVKNPALDRERADQYILTVQGQDLNGASGGNIATSTVVINVNDVNDNLPTLEKSEYEASIEENTAGVEVMRIKAEDVDMRATDNWEAVFDIVKGNEAGYFSIKTDPATNEGILMLDKAVNYEDVKNLELGLAVRNKAAPYGGSGGASGGSGASGGGSGTTYNTYPIKINVKNQPEGPSFDPKVKAIPVSEGGSIGINEVIGSYTAIDGDTGKAAENVRYVKGSDPGNWLTIDPKTAEIRLNKMPDRESSYLINGTYFAQVLCITEDMPSKTATGTVAIQVEDFNDHCPTLTNDLQTVCTPHDAVIVEAKDDDFFPNGAPFVFEIIPEGTKGKWQVEHYNDTAAILRAKESLWPGLYEVTFVVKDQQGQACPEPQKVTVQVCTCEDGKMCGEQGKNGQSKRDIELGPAGIRLLFLGLLLLLFLLLLLLFCKCGDVAGFTEMPFDTKSHLINYRTEGQGENTEVPLLNLPVQQDANMGMAKNTFAAPPMAGMGFQKSVSSMDGMNGALYGGGFTGARREEAWGNQPSSRGYCSEFENRESGGGGGMYDGMALPDHFLGQYYAQKVRSENENLGGMDGLLVYDYEGQGSLAGSVGCCSLLESENDLQFLDDLGMKFKTLAEVCGGKKIQTEVKPAFIPQPSPSIHTHTSASSVMTQQMPPPSQVQPPAPQTVVKEKYERSQVVKDGRARAMEGMTTVNTGRTTVNEGMTTVNTGRSTVNEGMMNQGQMILLQPQPQPVYYTTANPVLQQMQYIVQPQVQNTVMLAEAPTSNLQGMVLLNGTQTGHAQGIVVQGQTMISSGQAGGQRMVLLDGNGIHGSGGNLIHTGNLSGSQSMMVVEGKVPTGTMKGHHGSQTLLMQGGTLQSGGLSGSQRVLVVGGQSKGGHLVQEAGGLSQKNGIYGSKKVLYSKGKTSAGSQSNVVTSSSTTESKTPTYRKVLVQEKFTEL
ncbi:hypothetical protein CesoFtcFv8_004635 [Champsocephalus esox]|uniref:Cadherin domain-containing protein n=1 Tax=Champsocephalus esox TaxID=159716 RepID=A0AAN8HBN5_9TELE|nr:hypothetical protein CesoFtcFv8_004635 [Champsocephalus esox]